MKYLNDREVQEILQLISITEITEAIEEAFIDDSTKMVPKIYLDGDDGDFRAMPVAFKK